MILKTVAGRYTGRRREKPRHLERLSQDGLPTPNAAPPLRFRPSPAPTLTPCDGEPSWTPDSLLDSKFTAGPQMEEVGIH